jgi:hypothetical protein
MPWWDTVEVSGLNKPKYRSTSITSPYNIVTRCITRLGGCQHAASFKKKKMQLCFQSVVFFVYVQEALQSTHCTLIRIWQRFSCIILDVSINIRCSNIFYSWAAPKFLMNAGRAKRHLMGFPLLTVFPRQPCHILEVPIRVCFSISFFFLWEGHSVSF